MMLVLPGAACGGTAGAEAGCPSSAFGAEGTADLHVHSCFSDGLKTPAELCRMAVRSGVGLLALCDHDTNAGVKALMEAAGEQKGLCVLEGVEVSTGAEGRAHVLGYGPAVLKESMTAFLRQMGGDRQIRAEAILDRLSANGVAMPDEVRQKLLETPGVGRAHIARAMMEMGAVHTMQQAFDRYLAQGKCAYVARRLPSTAEAVRVMTDMGAVTVLAHPMRMGLDWPQVQMLVRELKAAGLAGIEAYHSSATARTARQMEAFARREGLLVTGGSDYHGDPGSSVRIGRLPGGWNARRDDCLALLDATRKAGINRYV